MSKILVDTIDTRSGTTTLTLGSTNAGTIALGSGDVQSNFLDPYFHVYKSSDQSISDNTDTKVQFNAELWDSNNCFDSSTNYRFTPTVAGKYYLFSQCRYTTGSANAVDSCGMAILKNGSTRYFENILIPNSNGNGWVMTSAGILDFNGSSDYAEVFLSVDVTGGTIQIKGNSTNYRMMSWFMGYRVAS